MNKESSRFIAGLLGLSVLLWLIHYTLLTHFFTTALYYPLWAIYLFNAVVVLLLYWILQVNQRKRPNDLLKLFLWLTSFKMLAALIFLLPLFQNKSTHPKLEVFNFFIPYFIYLILEISALNRVLQKS
jgi:hypothetical protein